jgi:hypothetical protein
MTGRVANLEDAVKIAGTLSYTSKMPCPSYSLPAWACKTGCLLAAASDRTVCANCYAKRGHYVFNNVTQAQQKRLASLTNPLWCDAITYQILMRDCLHFRWHDSGDIQSHDHLDKIIEVARRLPDVKFWLPTHEICLVRDRKDTIEKTPNLCVRVSDALINGKPTRLTKEFNFPTSGVTTKKELCTCPAQISGTEECGICRKCWHKDVYRVIYFKH